MGRWYDRISLAVKEDRVVFSLHAENQLASREILRWQAVAGFEQGALIAERLQATPNPKIEMRQPLPDGTDVIAIWSYVRSIRAAKLVTLYFEDRR